MKRSQIDAALDELYTRIPKMLGCDGRCWISCGPADMSDRERARIRAAGYRITPRAEAAMQAEVYWCEALTEDRRCAVYPLRPLICRIWGTSEDRKCPYGCVPDGGFLSAAKTDALLDEAERIGGSGLPPGKLPGREGADQIRDIAAAGIKIREKYNIPEAFRRKAEEFPCPSCGFTLTRPEGGDRTGRCMNCLKIIELP